MKEFFNGDTRERKHNQTAVEWLVDELLSGKPLMPSLIEQAKEMEKEEKQSQYHRGYKDGVFTKFLQKNERR